VEVVSGLWTAHFHDIEDSKSLTGVSQNITTVVNCATDKCPTKEGSYGPSVKVVLVEGLLDDPDARKKADAMPDGPEKEAALAALPQFPPEECAGDAKKDFERVNKAIDDAKADGKAALVHCHASLSRSCAFILAYMMKKQSIPLSEAIEQMRKKWSATWPNDCFVEQLLQYEKDLGITVEGVVNMKVTTKKSVGFYIKSAKSFFTGTEDKDGNKKEPVCVLNISGLGDAISTAVAAAAALESEGLGQVKKVQTSYPEMGGGGGKGNTCARIEIAVWHV